jgi:hypothetical protein
MAAKMKAKGSKHLMVAEPCSPQDVDNMRMCLELKFSQYPKLRLQLLETGDHEVVEDIGSIRGARHLLWGGRIDRESNQ